MAMSKNKKRHSGSARTYQDMKRKQAQHKQAMSTEANLPDKNGGRKISLISAVVMLVVAMVLLFCTELKLFWVLAIAFVCGCGTVFLTTWLAVRRNQEKTRRELK